VVLDGAFRNTWAMASVPNPRRKECAPTFGVQTCGLGAARRALWPEP
jgi:hypothetical protein